MLQRRKGHGKTSSLTSLFLGTIDSVFDTKPPPYRILHQTPTSEVYYSKFFLFLTPEVRAGLVYFQSKVGYGKTG